MMKKRTVLITGGAKRVGKEIALSLANKDTNLIIHYNKSLLEAKKLKPVHDGDTELRIAMKLIAETGKGPQEQFPSMGCSIKWFE